MNLKLSMKSKIRIILNKLRLTIGINRTKYFFTISLFEGYKKYVISFRIILTVIGLLSSFFMFNSAFIATLFGLIIYLLLSVLERIVLLYRSTYVHPLPDFALINEKWIGCAFGYAEPDNKQFRIQLVGIVLSDEEYAKKLHKYILRLSLGEHNDFSNNICISVIVISDVEYMFYLYPNIFKNQAQIFYKREEKERKKQSLSDIQQQWAIIQMLAKSCEYSENSYFAKFKSQYPSKTPVHLQFLVQNKDGQHHHIDGLKDIIINDFTIKERELLTRKDLEYDFNRIFHNFKD